MRRHPLTRTLVTVALLISARPPATDAASLLALVDTGEMFSSSNEGVSWTPFAAIPDHDGVALSAGLSNTDFYLFSRAGLVHRSTDAGLNWTLVGSLPTNDVTDGLVRPDGTLLALSKSGGLFRSTDHGASFAAIAVLPLGDATSLCVMKSGSRYYAATRTGEVYESLDAGASWSFRGAVPVSDLRKVQPLGTNLFALTLSGDVFRSNDRGVSWTGAGALSQVGMSSMLGLDGKLYCVDAAGEIAASADGSLWSWRGSVGQLTVTALASDEPASAGLSGDVAPTSWRIEPISNPSTGRVELSIDCPRAATLQVRAYDAIGRRIDASPPMSLTPGQQVVRWSPRGLRPGLYMLDVLVDGERARSLRWISLSSPSK